MEVESERQCGSETVEAEMTLNSGLGTWVLKVWFSEGEKKRERERIGIKSTISHSKRLRLFMLNLKTLQDVLIILGKKKKIIIYLFI